MVFCTQQRLVQNSINPSFWWPSSSLGCPWQILWSNSLMCGFCVSVDVLVNRMRRTCPRNNTRQYSEMFFSHQPCRGTEGTNDVIPICATITITNMGDIYKEACMHYPDSGNCIRVLFMEHLYCTCSEKCSQSSRTIIEFGLYVYVLPNSK